MTMSKLKDFLHILSKYLLYFIIATVIFVIVVVIALQMFSLYEEKKFINNCLAEGYSQNHCQNIWNEVDALN
jgi:hypothetical protein